MGFIRTGAIVVLTALAVAGCAGDASRGGPVVYSSGTWQATSSTPSEGERPGPAAGREARTPEATPVASTPASTSSVYPDATIAKLLVMQSLSAHEGPCVCPDDHDANGQRCGAGSLYAKGAEKKPLCTTGDVTPQMIAEFRKSKAR